MLIGDMRDCFDDGGCVKTELMGEYAYVVIGSAAAGISTLNTLWRLDPTASVLCISDEKEQPYNKCFLADYLSGEKPESQLFTKLFHKNVRFLFEKRVISIDRNTKTILMSDNASVRYGKLLLATGSSPVIPPIPGIQGEGVFTFHTLRDTHAILAHAQRNDCAHVTIMGGGLSGLEAADALRSHNLEVTLVERNERVLNSQVDFEAANLIQERMRNQGIQVLVSTSVEKIIRTDGQVSGVQLSDGSQVTTNAIICATGLAPNSQLARDAGLRLEGNSVWVDQYQQTSDEHIYAAGDVVVVRDQLSGQLVRSCTWPDAMHQGIIAAHAMSDNRKPYPGIVMVASSAFFGVKFAACGYNSNSLKGDGIATVSCKGSPDEYCKMFVKEGVPQGFIMIGSSLPQLGALRRAVVLRQPYTPKPYKTIK